MLPNVMGRTGEDVLGAVPGQRPRVDVRFGPLLVLGGRIVPHVGPHYRGITRATARAPLLTRDRIGQRPILPERVREHLWSERRVIDVSRYPVIVGIVRVDYALRVSPAIHVIPDQQRPSEVVGNWRTRRIIRALCSRV
jgi:hypothetical protein